MRGADVRNEDFVRVKFFASYRKITGCRICDMPATDNLRTLLHQVSERWPGLRTEVLSPDGSALGKDAIILVNGRSIEHLQGIETPLSEQDTVSMFPRVAGG
jgi:molybdopterin synthase sulfur carrier subunit